MEVIVIASDAFYALFDKLKNHWSGQADINDVNIIPPKEIFLKETEVMEIFGIKNKVYWGRFRDKHNIPSVKVGKRYVYRKDLIDIYTKEGTERQVNPPRKRKKS